MTKRSSKIDEFPSWELLDRYNASEATPAELDAMKQYLSENQVKGRVVEEVRSNLISSSHSSEISEARVGAMLKAAHDRIRPQLELKRLVQSLFGGSVHRAVTALLDIDDSDMTDDEIETLRNAILRAKNEGR